MNRTLKFEKDYDSRWYVVLPEWTGSREDLEMVCGADTMLDILAQGEDIAYITMSDEPMGDYKFSLTFIDEENGGGNYILVGEYSNFEVWLCYVTKFVFGKLPKTIYCK